MATYIPYSQSPRLHAGDPITPVHSPHHSVHSSVSSRTPIHTLTIHEYRKQQHTPLSQNGTPPGKTLRRKAGAPALSDIERTPSITRTTQSSLGLTRPLHFAQSAHQLNSSQAPFQQSTFTSLALRSQSAEPRVQLGSISSTSTANSSSKVRYFNSRKRLPKPPAASGPRSIPLSFANVKAAQQPHSPPPALSFSTESFLSSGAQTTSSPSTFSLSRFPQPPHLVDPSFSPPHDDGDPTRINALSFTTTAPATPPTTPAIIHYRGTSFDLVNPHDSLLLHDIVTPSREYDSSEYLPLRSSDEAHEASAEMAPKRSLYGDLNSARAGIMRRADDSFSRSNIDFPLPPTPAAISPNSSSYTSPMYSPESINIPSPLHITKPASDSRFSLKQLTRTLTKKLGKSPVKSHEEELQDMRDSSVSLASIDMDGEYPRPLGQTYVATPQPSYFPAGPMSPVTPTSPNFLQNSVAYSPEEHNVKLMRRDSTGYYDMEPLSSMVPDEQSPHIGRMDNSRLSEVEQGRTSKPYYDDLDSIYPSSSIYTADDRRKSNYQHSLVNHQSNPFARCSGMDAGGFAYEYTPEGIFDYSTAQGASQQMSRPITQEPYNSPFNQADRNTDTISKFIERYNLSDRADNQIAKEHEQLASLQRDTGSSTLADESSFQNLPSVRGTSGISQFDFNLDQNAQPDPISICANQDELARQPNRTRDVGLPPSGVAPLAPAFEYEDAPFVRGRPDLSDMFSTSSSYSYSDTRNLLQISRTDVQTPHVAGNGLQPSSSYSQPEAPALQESSSYSQAEASELEPAAPYSEHVCGSPQVSQEVLNQAEQIFNDAATEGEQPSDEIPAMWAGRGSGSNILSKKLTVECAGGIHNSTTSAMEFNEDKADWETLAGDSQGGRDSPDSIADYSSSEDSRNSLGLKSDGSLPSWTQQNFSRGPSYYSPPRAHTQPLTSSPQDLQSLASLRTAPESSSPRLLSSPPVFKSKPLFQFSSPTEDTVGYGAIEEPFVSKPWADPYGFSDKETLELLASGPNDDIIIEKHHASPTYNRRLGHRHIGHATTPMASTPESVLESSVGLERQNTFEKLSIVGPKGNLTGTPRGTGMHETGSSVADTSSPGQRLSSSAGRHSFRSDFTGFYASPFPATGSITRIHGSQPPQRLERTHSRTHSQGDDGLEPASSPPITPINRRQHFRNSTTFERARRVSRAAVPGQTKLRQMVLAPAGRAAMGSQDTRFSKSLGGSERPSTSDTNTPLRATYNLSVATLPPLATARNNLAQQHSPHLLCLERATNSDDEARRRKLSWFILAAFCLIPPCILLYRLWGDSIIASFTEGRLSYCTPQSKKAALIAGIVVNVGLVTAILVPILVAHALKAV